MSLPHNEFSRMVEIKKLNSVPKEYDLTPNDQELQNLAKRFLLLELMDVNSVLNVSKKGSRVFIEASVKGRLQTDKYSQILEFQEDVKVLLFTDKTAKDFDAEKLEDDVNSDWDCDLLEEDVLEIDIGEIVSQYISLAMIGMDAGVQEEGRVIELF